MGWFSKLFAKEESKQSESIKLSDLEPWFESKVSYKLKSVSSKVEEFIKELNSETLILKERLETLKKASLHNPNIPLKAKQYMEGNREAYIKSIMQFTSSLEIDELDSLKIPEFCTTIKKKLESLATTTQKPYTILQEFFAHESSDIARSLKKIFNIITDLEKLYNESALYEISSIKEDVRNLNNKILQRDSLNKAIISLEIELKSLSENLLKLNLDKEALIKSEAYRKYNDLKLEKSRLAQEFKSIEQNFIDNFQSLEPALKRFVKISFNDEILINQYLLNPVKSLLNDKNLQFIGILENLSRNIHSNAVQLKDKKEKKTLEKIKEISSDYLKSFIEHHNSLSAKIKDINQIIEQTGTEKSISDLNQKINDETYRLDNKSINLSNLNKEYNKVDINLLIKNLSNKLSLFFKEEVSIST